MKTLKSYILGVATLLLFTLALLPQQAEAQMIPPEWPLPPPSQPGDAPPPAPEPVIDPNTGQPMTPEEAAYAALTVIQQQKLLAFYQYKGWAVPDALMYCIIAGISRRDEEDIGYN